MSSYQYPPQYRQSGASSYNTQQRTQYQAQQQRPRQQSTQHSAQSSAAYYPSPESTSPSSDGSSPTYYQSSPTQYKSAPSGQGYPPAQQQQRRSSQYSVSSTSSKDANWYCMYNEHQGTAFARKADLKRHYDQVHNADTVRSLDCQVPSCHRRGDLGFGRKDKLVEHMREVHKADIPKRTSGERRQ